jgi:hypothetical protein
MKKESVLARSSDWVPGSWVFNFEKNSQLEPKMGTSQQPEPKLGTSLQLEPDPEPELTPKRIAHNFWLLLVKIKNSSFIVVFYPLSN